MKEEDFKLNEAKTKIVMDGDILLTREEVLRIPIYLLPMPVLSDNIRSFFSWGIKVHERGNYNHFMWLIRPGIVASQGLLYGAESIDTYFEKCRLKFWYHPNWTQVHRQKIMAAIQKHLDRPWYRRIYDVPAIFGQLFWHELQTPGLDICSDSGSYLAEVDESYDLRHPDPEQVNKWMESKPEYKVYGRYLPD